MTPAGKDRPSGLNRLKERISSATHGDPTELFGEIARQVTEQRVAWNLSQKELADLCGTTQSAIARLEAGRRPPRIDTLERVARALDCELKIELKPKTGDNGR